MGSGASVRQGAEVGKPQWEKLLHNHRVEPSAPTLSEDVRTSGVYIQGKGTLKTYMFEEQISICRYFDVQAGLWLLLPLYWEMDMDFVRHRVEQVMKALPGLIDKKEITAALRQCNYDPDEVISIYLTIFGDVLLQPHKGAQPYPDFNSFRSFSEKDQTVEELKQKLHMKEKEAEDLLQKNSRLTLESQHLSDVVQNLTRRVVELEADKQVAMEKLRAILSHPADPSSKLPLKARVDTHHLIQISHVVRKLNVSSKQLCSVVRDQFADVLHQLQKLRSVAELVTQREQQEHGTVEELRSRYQKEALERKMMYNKFLDVQGSIRVFCRCRGPSDKPASTSCLEVTSDQELLLLQRGEKKKFHFDHVFSSSASQEDVFDGILPIVMPCLEGYNVCILSYGESGSGKSYTMIGFKDEPGISIRSIKKLLHLCNEKENSTYTVKVSMLEIYVENLNDLLTENPNNELEIRSHGRLVTVPGLTQVEVKTEEDVAKIVEMVEKNSLKETDVESSCSHLLVSVLVESTDMSGATTRGTLTLCDLAASERVSKTQATGQRLTETAAINKSLTALRQVFTALKANTPHVPFRNSKITHLLQPSLSGEARTCVFVHVIPDARHATETLNSLTFGSSIRHLALGKVPQNRTLTKPNKAEKHHEKRIQASQA